MLMIFEFRDFTPIEAFVLARDFERAEEMFDRHLRAHGGDPDMIMWRQWTLRTMAEPEKLHVREARALKRERLLIRHADERWVFVDPIGYLPNS